MTKDVLNMPNLFANMSIVKDIMLGAEKHGANLQMMCKELELNPADIYHSEIKVPFDKAYKVWEIAVGQTNDDLLGLHLGEETYPSIMGLVGYLMQSSPNLLEAFKSVCKFGNLSINMFAYSISVEGEEVRLSYQPCDPWLRVSPLSARQGTELAMAGTLNVFKILAGRKIYPQRVMFSYGRHKNFIEYERVFNSPIQWNAPGNSLIFTKAQLLTPVVSYDESIMGIFCDLIKERFEEIKVETFSNQIKSEIMTTFKGQLPSIESMAARFNMTVRSFQRKLDEENLPYRQLCRNLGRDFATNLLSNKSLRISDVASALGYSNVRAFQRAFKSWTGQSPADFRASIATGQPR